MSLRISVFAVSSDCQNFEKLNVVSAYFCLNIHAEGPYKSNEWPKYQKSEPTWLLLTDVKTHSLNKTWYCINITKVLVNITRVESLESIPGVIKVFPAAWVHESVVHKIMDKDNKSHRPNIVDTATVVLCVGRVQTFRVSICDDLFSCCVSLCLGSSISVRDCPCVDSCLVMVTFDMEDKMPIQSLDSQVFLSELPSMFNVVQVTEQRVTAQCQNQIKRIDSCANACCGSDTEVCDFWNSNGYNDGNSDPEEKCSNQRLDMVRGLFFFKLIDICGIRLRLTNVRFRGEIIVGRGVQVRLVLNQGRLQRGLVHIILHCRL